MASPFRAFRKYQKTLLAVAGVVLMFVFVVGDPLSQYLSGHASGGGAAGQRPNDVAVKWNGGELTNAELGQLVFQRAVVNNFLRQVEGLGREAAFQAAGEAQPLRVEMLVGPERPQEGVEQHVLRTRLFADSARQAGMAVSDDYIVNYLQQLGRGHVTVEVLRQILDQMQANNRGISANFVLDSLREELLANNYLASYFYSIRTGLPEQRWRDWLNANDRVVVEAAAIPAESLLVDVPEPTDAELVAFYNDYKDVEPGVDGQYGVELPLPTPAFAVPRRVAVQYLLADFNQFLDKVEGEVTDAEIEKFYEENKDPHFIRTGADLSDVSAEGDSVEAETATPAGDDSKGDDAPKAESQDEDTSEVPQPNEESLLRMPAGPFRLTAFADETPASGESKAETLEPTTTAEAKAEDVQPSTPAESAADEVEPAKEFQPLDDVRDEIRRQIAQYKVTEQLENLINSLQTDLDHSFNEYLGASLDAEGEGKEPPPPPPALADLTPLAQKNQLVYQKTDPAAMLELQKTPVGMSVLPNQSNFPFYYAIFGRDVELYQPLVTYDLDANRYLAMKTADIPAKVPPLTEIRDEVVRAWKLRKAGELALKRAGELAKQAQDSGASLEDALVNDKSVKVFRTDPFSYLTAGTVSRDTRQVQSFRLSEPDGIVAAGPELLEEIFSLKDGEVGAAPNHDHSIAYVVRIAEHLDTPAELQQAFLSEADNWYGYAAMASARARRAAQDLIGSTLEEADVDWERPADQIIQPAAADDETAAADET